MKTSKPLYIAFILFLYFFSVASQSISAAEISFMVIDANSYLANLTVEQMAQANRSRIEVISAGELSDKPPAIAEAIEASSVIVVDVMGRELEEYLSNTIDIQGKTVYALRGSSDDERLKKLGYIFDETIREYYSHISQENIANMLRFVIHRHLDERIPFLPVQPVAQSGIYHPDAESHFSKVDDYQQWLSGRAGYESTKPRLGLLFFSSFLTPGQKKPLDLLIRRLDAEGFTTYPCFGRDLETIEHFLLNDAGSSNVDLVLAYSLKFYSALNPELARTLVSLDVPILSAISLYRNSLDEWRESPVGISNQEIAWSMAAPELSGLVEPTVLTAKEEIVDHKSGKHYLMSSLVEENIERLIPRLHRWIELQRKDNREKKIAIIYYNHNQGKQNIGASYLNIFSSIDSILHRLAEEGYQTGNKDEIREEQIKKLILTYGRNVGSWAPGELKKLVAAGDVTRLPLSEYERWFEELPAEFREKVNAQWGKPSANMIMMSGGDMILPMIQKGNIVLMPEPARGWGDDPEKLYHDRVLYPHHQYIAAYLWLQKRLRADAMIHLGTHATYEWTPGKQAGLSPSCPPEVLLSDIPNLYPYIVDNVGEALQAKRRGRGVMISHLTPMLKRSGLYKEYSRMAELANEYQRAVARGSSTAPEKFKELQDLLETSGVEQELEAHRTDHNRDSDHDRRGEQVDGAAEADRVHHLLHYLEEIKEQMIPYGMHHFGQSKGSDELEEMSRAIAEMNPEEKPSEMSRRLTLSAAMEMDNLIAGLAGRFVEPGGGNDPLRNPAALPTGRNLYGLNPNKLPSKAAWNMGKKAADDIINNYLEKHREYPQKVAVVLWAVELQRNEGINESTILYLMGIRPRWQSSGRVAGLQVIPRKELGRPRIDVMINASGLYRDLFPEKLEMLDNAVQLAIREADIDNLLSKNSRKLQRDLLKRGFSKEDADEMSRMRVFAEESGSYGNGVAELTSASSLWNDEADIAKVYNRRSSFAFGENQWSKDAQEAFKANLAGVEVVVHSSSSNVYGLLDNDDMYQYLGGLAMAVRQASGKKPETVVTSQKKAGSVRVEDLAATLGKELRSRYFNPKWIEGMKREDYAGARAMAQYIEYLWGWQVTTPDKVSNQQWQESYEVYVEDKYELDLKKFFNKASPWAYQSLTARMLETVRKGYWKPDDKVQQKLAVDYAVSVVEKGVACCDHTCNNPMLNQMVISLLSIPGIINTEVVEQFQLAVEQAAKKKLTDQVVEKKELVKELTTVRSNNPEDVREQAEIKETEGASKVAESDGEQIEGYKMEKISSNDESTKLTSSGGEWLAGLAVLFFMGLIAFGSRRKM